MISVKEKENLLKNLNSNCLDPFTIECVIRYVNITTDIFDIDHDILINNISNNLKNNIKISKNFNFTSNILGLYNYDSKQIIINSKINNKQHIISLIFHELDHVANLNYINSDEKNKYLAYYIKKLNEKYTFIMKLPFIKYFIEKNFLKLKPFSCGFNNPFIGKLLGINLNLFKEGITTYKQSKYEQYLNLTDRITNQNSDYKNEMKVAKLIMEVIGEDIVVKLEQKNDFWELKKIFDNITQKQVYLEDLIHQLNNTNIYSNRYLENQKKLNDTLKKISLCKKAYDYHIELKPINLSLNEIENLLSSYENKNQFQNNIRQNTYENTTNHNYNLKQIESEITEKSYEQI